MPWTRFRPELTILLGFALLLNPFVVGALDIGDPDRYRYEPATVEFHENGTYDAPARVPQIDSEVACFDNIPSRACTLERAIHSQGGIEFDGAPGGFLHRHYEYVFVWNQGFFVPTGDDQGSASVRYGLEAVPRDRALADIATPIRDAPAGVRDAIRSGSFETRDELDGANELVVADDTYYVVYTTSAHVEYGTERTRTVIVGQWVAGLIGGILVLRGQRERTLRNYHKHA